MKTIVVMRHAKAEKQTASDQDFDRQLTPDGVTMATRTAVALNHGGIRLDRIICSSSARTAQTAEIVSSVADFNGEVVKLDELYLAESRDIAAAIRDHSAAEDQTVLLVGHNPGVAELMCGWAGESLEVPPATAAVFETPIDDWTNLGYAGNATNTGYRVRRLIRRGEVVV